MPVPPKSVIQPDKFTDRFKADSASLQNPSYAALIRDLEQAGVLVADVTAACTGMWSSPGKKRDAYLAADTHWRPEAMERAARYLKQYIDRNVPLPPRSLPDSGVGMPAPPEAGKYRAQAAGVTNRGDLAVMLRLPACPSSAREWARGYPSESVRLRQILTARGETWAPDETSDVLVLGDSFSNIYSLDAMGWGESAGLIEQLSFELQRPLDRLVINDNGAYATRALLARELARGRDRLAGKRLVIWQFAMRELSAGDWQSVALTLGKPAPDLFVVLEPGKDLSVRGVVQAIAPVPRPGTVPYKDHIVAAHIVDVECGEQAIPGNQALVYLQSMRDNVWTPAARLRPGDSVTMRLRPWSDVAPRYERINRTELSDDALQLAEPCWGEWTPADR
jgi:alginate O-acetyltransferase complex protein AlgJ